jgi:hypothetical protein
MYESNREYVGIVLTEKAKLGAELGIAIHHGDAGVCPHCKRPGKFDIASKGFDFPQDNSIYYSTVWNEWHCEDCERKRVE